MGLKEELDKYDPKHLKSLMKEKLSKDSDIVLFKYPITTHLVLNSGMECEYMIIDNSNHELKHERLLLMFPKNENQKRFDDLIETLKNLSYTPFYNEWDQLDTAGFLFIILTKILK